MRALGVIVAALIGCGSAAPGASDDTDTPAHDPYAGIEPADALVPLSSVSGRQAFHVMDATLEGDAAWFATFRGGMGVDVSDPEAPASLGPSQGAQLYGADADEDFVLFSGRESGVFLLGRQEDGQLDRIARRSDETEAPERAILVGEHAVIAAQADGLIVADLARLQTVAQLELPSVFAVAAGGEDQVVVGDRERGLVVVDLSEPSAPRELGAVALLGDPQDIVVADGVAWVAAGSRVLGVDLSDPSRPEVIASLASRGVATRLDASSGLLAVAAWTDTRVYDVADPTSPVLLATEDATESATSVALRDELLVVGDWNTIRLYSVDREAFSAELRADRSLLLVGDGELSGRLAIDNEGRLPLQLTGVSCDDERVSATLGVEELLPGEATSISLVAQAGDEQSFEATCTLASSDIDEPSHPILVRVNPSGLSVGDRAPDFTLPDLDGTLHSLTDTQGKVVIISVFSSL